jgi:hypothetical protein
VRREHVHVQWTGEHYEVRRQRPDGVSEVLGRCAHWETAMQHRDELSEPRAVVRLPASSSLRRLGRRFIGRG